GHAREPAETLEEAGHGLRLAFRPPALAACARRQHAFEHAVDVAVIDADHAQHDGIAAHARSPSSVTARPSAEERVMASIRAWTLSASSPLTIGWRPSRIASRKSRRAEACQSCGKAIGS